MEVYVLGTGAEVQESFIFVTSKLSTFHQNLMPGNVNMAIKMQYGKQGGTHPTFVPDDAFT